VKKTQKTCGITSIKIYDEHYHTGMQDSGLNFIISFSTRPQNDLNAGCITLGTRLFLPC
jgi:hypothetical protein